ncbi:MAG: hypothetical protein P8090_13525, partial [Gammaproteobacteria bacterium]
AGNFCRVDKRSASTMERQRLPRLATLPGSRLSRTAVLRRLRGAAALCGVMGKAGAASAVPLQGW